METTKQKNSIRLAKLWSSDRTNEDDDKRRSDVLARAPRWRNPTPQSPEISSRIDRLICSRRAGDPESHKSTSDTAELSRYLATEISCETTTPAQVFVVGDDQQPRAMMDGLMCVVDRRYLASFFFIRLWHGPLSWLG
jgi:hypothetical protein